jgi:hypothetical protein
VANELIVQGQIESIDGMGYLVSLDEGIPELPNVERARCRWDSTMSSSRLAV